MSEKKGNVAEKGEDGGFTIVAPHVLDFAFRGQVQSPQFRLSSQVRQFEMRALHRQQEASAASLVSLSNRQGAEHFENGDTRTRSIFPTAYPRLG